MQETYERVKLKQLKGLVDRLCGIYSRVARRLGVHRTLVSRVASGERHSRLVENALVDEFDQAQKRS